MSITSHLHHIPSLDRAFSAAVGTAVSGKEGASLFLSIPALVMQPVLIYIAITAV